MATTFKQGNVTVSMFFDRAAVLDRLSRQEARVLNKTGGESRQIVRRSMRSGGKSQKASRPGEPPRYQTKILRDGIFYGYDDREKSVVIGPIKSRSKSTGNTPLILEQGGIVHNAVVRVVDAAKSGKRKKDRKYRYITTTLKMQPRPYLGPASVNYPKMISALNKNIERYQLL